MIGHTDSGVLVWRTDAVVQVAPGLHKFNFAGGAFETDRLHAIPIIDPTQWQLCAVKMVPPCDYVNLKGEQLDGTLWPLSFFGVRGGASQDYWLALQTWVD